MFGTFDSKSLELLDYTSALELSKANTRNVLDHRLNIIASDSNESGRFTRFRTANLQLLKISGNNRDKSNKRDIHSQKVDSESKLSLTGLNKHDVDSSAELDFEIKIIGYTNEENPTSSGAEWPNAFKVALDTTSCHLYFGILTTKNRFQVFHIIRNSIDLSPRCLSTDMEVKESNKSTTNLEDITSPPLHLPKCFRGSYIMQNVLLPDIRENEISFHAVLYWYEAVRGNSEAAEGILQNIDNFFEHEEQSSQEKVLVAHIIILETILACNETSKFRLFFNKACALAEKLLFERRPSDKEDDGADLSMKEMWYIKSICVYDAFSAGSFLNGTTLSKASYMKVVRFPLQSPFSVVAMFLPLVNEIAIYSRRIDDIYEILKFEGLLDEMTEELLKIERIADNIETIIKERKPAEGMLDDSKNFSRWELETYGYVFELLKLTLHLFLNVFVRRLRGPTLSNWLRTLKILELLEILVFQCNWKEPFILSLILVSLVSPTNRAKDRIARLLKGSSLNKQICEILLAIVERNEESAFRFEYMTTLSEVLKHFPLDANFL